MRTFRSWLALPPTALSLLALLLIWALFFWRFAAPNPVDRLTYERGDFSETFGVFRDLTYRALNAGRLPLWAECLWSGYPLHADPQAQVFYPPAWLTFAGLRALGYGHFPLEALTLESALHYLFTSIFYYAFLRSRGVRQAAAVFGAVTYTYGGYLTGYAPLQTAVLHSNLWLPLALLFAGRLAETRSPRHLALTTLALAATFLAGHPQTFTFIALVTLAYFVFHAARLAFDQALPRLLAYVLALVVLTAALSAVQLLPSAQFILNSTRASVAFDQAGHGFPFQDIVQMLLPGIASYWSTLYVGLLPLTLAGLALTRRDPDVRFWAGAALISLVLSFGTRAVAYDAAYWTIPGLALFRGAERLGLIVSLALAMLAAYGADLALSALSRLGRQRMEAAARVVSSVWLGGAIVLAGVMLLQSANVAEWQWGPIPDRLGQFVVMGALALAALVMRLRAPFLRRWMPIVFVSVAVIDLFAANRPLNVSAPYQPYPPDPVVAPIQAEAGFFRVQDDGRLAGHAGCGYGFREIDGVTPYRLAAYDQLLAAREPVRWTLLGVRFVVTWRAELFDQNGQRIASEIVAQSEVLDEKGNPTRTHRLLQSPRRAWLTDDIEANPAPVLAAPLESNPIEIVRDEAGLVQLRAAPQGDALLVVSEAHDAGWEVAVDGRPAPLLRAYGALLAVALPAGEHSIEFRYQPEALWWGGLISVVALVFAAVLAFFPRSILKLMADR